MSGGADLRQFGIDIARASEQAKTTAGEILAKTAFDIQRDAKVLAPVGETGDLKNSISVDLDRPNLHAEIGPTVEYGIYQEMGTIHHPPQPYLGPATERRLAAYYQALENLAEDLSS